MNEIQVDDTEINYEEGLRRFSNRADLYEKYLLKFLSEKSFAEIQAAFIAQNYPAAFRHAHNLKGLSGNLSLNRLHQQLKPFVEALRNGYNISEAKKLYPQLESTYLSTTTAIKKMLK